MTSYLRRFVYLVVDGKRPRTLDLHRIDMARFFTQRSPLIGAAVDARLPRPQMTFYAPSSEDRSGRLQFLLLHCNKYSPISVTVGQRLYVLDSSRRVVGAGYDDWRYSYLPSPPYRPGDIDAYAVVGGSDVWVSSEDEGTYSFDTFRGLAEYVPEYKLWFGLSSSESSNLFCTFNLAAAARRLSPPIPRNVWEDLCPPKGWLQVTSSLVHLGSGRFCIARFFCDEPGDADDDPWKMFAILIAVEVRPRGKSGKGLQMVRHISECYSLPDNNLNQWVL
ncbi:hypothetical protein PVAP13_9KG602200 [Panicum virgatum]|uniref:Uncharacterized protein n=1 Tax=Panicum virgatum TaxID=38727 RepID=A0A8T0P1H3_PANVG|nr:hypothetical protein PVAP13_9KG602200 [Panicum virgatum]